MVKNQFGVM